MTHKRNLLVMFDEGLQDQELDDTCISLRKEGLIYDSMPPWVRKYRLKDGAYVNRPGVFRHNEIKDYKKAFGPEFDSGKVVERKGTSDHYIAEYIGWHLASFDIIFLTKNTKKGKKEIRSILKNEIAPYLGSGESLSIIFKKDKADITEFCAAFDKFIRAKIFLRGYSEYRFRNAEIEITKTSSKIFQLNQDDLES